MREITPDVEALHQIIGVGNFEANGSTGSNTYDLAFRIVDSEWLAEHDRAVAEAAAVQALVDIGKYIVETPEMVQGMQGYLNDWHHPESVLEWIRDEIDARAASISTDKAGAGDGADPV